MRKFSYCIISLLIFLAACSGPVREREYKIPARPLPKKDVKLLLSGASKHIGEPYKFGGLSKRGWDCSGFVCGMFKRYLGINLPRDTEGLYSASIGIKMQNSRPGDLVFFSIKSNKPSHVGIYAGKNRFIHSSTSSGVTVSSLNESYYRHYFTGFRRIRFSFISENR